MIFFNIDFEGFQIENLIKNFKFSLIFWIGLSQFHRGWWNGGGSILCKLCAERMLFHKY